MILAAAIAFTVVHYLVTAYVFLMIASYAGDIDGINPALSPLQSQFLTGAFFVMLFPLGFAPFGVLVNSPVLGYGLYRLLALRFLTDKTS